MVFKKIQEDIDAFMARDPAARSGLEVILCYPGFHALMAYRVSNWLWKRNWRLLARCISHIAKIISGIEIHPGAQIGKRFVIDHGTGVVIGETAVIGEDVTLYHAVTLGGVSPAVDSSSQVNVKRHPTLCDGVIVGSGAQVLGPITIGKNARVGANAVVHMDVPAGVTAVGIPAKVVMPKDRRKAKEFVAYGEPVEGAPDPVLQTIEGLRGQVETLMDRIGGLEEELAEAKLKARPRKSSAKPVKKPVAVEDKKAG